MATVSTADMISSIAQDRVADERFGEGKVVIIGAGCTGCALGQGLKKAGIPCIIYEARRRGTASREWNMGLHWAVPGLRSLIDESLWAKIQSAQVDPHYETGEGETVPFFHGESGAMLAQLKMDHLYRLHRDRFRDLLSDGLDIHEGKTLASITYSDDGRVVTAHFTDGGEDSGLILVGADGPKSTVRNILLGSDKSKTQTLDYASTMCFTKYTRDQALFLRSDPAHPLFQIAPHPMNLFAVLGLHNAPDPDKPEDWTFFHYISFPEAADLVSKKSKSEHVAHQKEMAALFADPFKSAFAWMPEDSEAVWYGKLNHWDPSDPDHGWDNYGGRVTLAGDSAHPMTFQRGQGLNHAITDAVKLCDAITGFWHQDKGIVKEERAASVSAYEIEVKERGGEEVRLSAKNTEMLHDWKKVLQSPVFKSGLNQGN